MKKRFISDYENDNSPVFAIVLYALLCAVIVLAGSLTTGCATRHFERTTTTTYTDGRVVVEEVKATDNSLCYDSSLEGFAWESSPSNTSVRLDKHGSTGGSSNVVAVCETLNRQADAAKEVAKAIQKVGL